MIEYTKYNLHVGEKKSIRFEIQGSCGFTWQFDKLRKSPCVRIISLVSEPYNKDKIGAPVYYNCELEAIYPGVVDMDYLRPWDKIPDKRLVITVI